MIVVRLREAIYERFGSGGQYVKMMGADLDDLDWTIIDARAVSKKRS